MMFEWVLPFHEPGLAPVGDESGAYHIHLDGSQAYEQRFDRTFGFYCGLAAVVQSEAWFHVRTDGTRAYDGDWSWAGNFQQNRCTVRNRDGHYFHIRPDGSLLDGGPHSYAGDFREGAAVVRGMDGMCWHIDMDGVPIHESRYLDLDVFHKGFARARDSGGWHHINRSGADISQGRRYSELEPFYNGQALVRSLTGEYLVINEDGLTRVTPIRPSKDVDDVLQHLAVSTWRPIAIRLGILAGIAGGGQTIAVDPDDLKVLKSAWIEMGLLTSTGELSEVGERLSPGRIWEDRFLYWTGPQLDAWNEAERRLTEPDSRVDFFRKHSEDEDMSNLIQRVLHSYACEDWRGILGSLRLHPDDTVVDLGGGKGVLLNEIGGTVEGRILVDRLEVVDGLELDGIRVEAMDIFTDDLPSGDVYILSRVLHDWHDEKCNILLGRIPKPSRVIVIDRISEPGVHGMLSLNMLLLTGGRERSRDEWHRLFSSSGWMAEHSSEWSGHTVFSLMPAGDES